MANISYRRLLLGLCSLCCNFFVITEPSSFWGIPRVSETGKINETGFTSASRGGRNASSRHLVFTKRLDGPPGAIGRLVGPWKGPTGPQCQLNLSAKVDYVPPSPSNPAAYERTLSIFIKRQNVNPEKLWTLENVTTSVLKSAWTTHSIPVGAIPEPFYLILESTTDGSNETGSVTVGRTLFFDCDPNQPSTFECNLREFLCPSTFVCLSLTSVCDYQNDCPSAEDELDEICTNRAYPGSCDFEVDTCQWETSAPVQPSGTSWKRRHGPIRPNASSLKNPSNSDSGYYMLFETLNGGPLDWASVETPPIPAPPLENWDPKSPYYQTCRLSFYHQMYGRHVLHLLLHIFEVDGCCNNSTCGTIVYKNYWTQDRIDVDTWQRISLPVPHLRKRFVVRFEAVRGLRTGHVSIDDISLTRECYGQGIMNASSSSSLSSYDDSDCEMAPSDIYDGSSNLTSIQNDSQPSTMNMYSLLALTVGSLTVGAFVVLLIVVSSLSAHRRQRTMKQALQLQQQQLQQQEQTNTNVDFQLSLIRSKRNAYLGKNVNYNPCYEFGGNQYTMSDLTAVPRTNITLVKALGHGAFGEVYQGILIDSTQHPTRSPVAIKTLPAFSTGQAQNDFIMEALIMSMFDHKNIVKLLGVCFERHPQFIVLELLEGGDVKTFLYRSRPKPNQAVELTIQDLLHLSLDIAAGCRYLEENHFVHRDIAARNCLITTTSWGRVAKIADFGMARDVYKSDYYKKSGKAMLPVRWMPPEALLNGMFTTKTDVWSFGVLLWEIFSLGYRPYPGLSNQDVIQLVTSGGRLQVPENCPQAVSAIMNLCWTGPVNERPQFDVISNLLQECLKGLSLLQEPQTNDPQQTSPRLSSNNEDTRILVPYLPIINDDSSSHQPLNPHPAEMHTPSSPPLPLPSPNSAILDATGSTTVDCTYDDSCSSSISEETVQPSRSELIYLEPLLSSTAGAL